MFEIFEFWVSRLELVLFLLERRGPKSITKFYLRLENLSKTHVKVTILFGLPCVIFVNLQYFRIFYVACSAYYIKEKFIFCFYFRLFKMSNNVTNRLFRRTLIKISKYAGIGNCKIRNSLEMFLLKSRSFLFLSNSLGLC